jgi:hypothetical protein
VISFAIFYDFLVLTTRFYSGSPKSIHSKHPPVYLQGRLQRTFWGSKGSKIYVENHKIPQNIFRLYKSTKNRPDKLSEPMHDKVWPSLAAAKFSF